MGTLAGPLDIGQVAGDEIRIQAAAVKNWHGGAAAIVMGVGYATPLVVATDAHQFIGVYLETNDNSGGVAGTIVKDDLNRKSSWVRVARRGCFQFTQGTIAQAKVGLPVWFSDDNTVTTTPGVCLAGIIARIDQQPTNKCWVDIENAVRPIRGGGLPVLSASGAIPPRTPATYVITKAGVAALTLAAPTTIVDDGMIITVISSTAFAHTLTATGLLQTGTATVNLGTFAAFAGAQISLMAYGGLWFVIGNTAVTLT